MRARPACVNLGNEQVNSLQAEIARQKLPDAVRRRTYGVLYEYLYPLYRGLGGWRYKGSSSVSFTGALNRGPNETHHRHDGV